MPRDPHLRCRLGTPLPCPLAYAGPLPAGALAHSGILDSQRDNAFNFVDDALAAAKRKQ